MPRGGIGVLPIAITRCAGTGTRPRSAAATPMRSA